MTPTHDEEMAHERAYWHERIVEALQRVRQLDADPILPEGIRELCLVRDLMDDTLDEVQE